MGDDAKAGVASTFKLGALTSSTAAPELAGSLTPVVPAVSTSDLVALVVCVSGLAELKKATAPGLRVHRVSSAYRR